LKKIGLPLGILDLAALAPILPLKKLDQGSAREGTLPEFEGTPSRPIIGRLASSGTPGRGDFRGFWPKTLREDGKTGASDSRTIVRTGIDANRLLVIFTSPASLLMLFESRSWVSSTALSG
jgi:hypothetical protein